MSGTGRAARSPRKESAARSPPLLDSLWLLLNLQLEAEPPGRFARTVGPMLVNHILDD